MRFENGLSAAGARRVWTLLAVAGASLAGVADGSSPSWDVAADTWVGTDALGRRLPTIAEVGPVKRDQRRVVGIFYVTWHTGFAAQVCKPYTGDVTKLIQKDPKVRLDRKHPLWTDLMNHWGEPEAGYFTSSDEWVIRRDLSMLSDAGVDVLVLDVTNAVLYWDDWEALFRVMTAMKAEGNAVPQFCFWAFNGKVVEVVQQLYDRYYRTSRYADLWFLWDGKPLLLLNSRPQFIAGGSVGPLTYPKEILDFFTTRTMWWGYYKWGGERFIGTEDNWSYGYDLADPAVARLRPEELLSLHKGRREQAAVTPAQHPVSTTPAAPSCGVGKSWTRKHGEPPLDERDLPVSAIDPKTGKAVANPSGLGLYFQERWDEAIACNPEFLYVNDWNEWTAGLYETDEVWLRTKRGFRFIDQYNAEFNRTVSPMKGGYTDNYYMQMAANVRRYKGVRPQPESHRDVTISVDGKFADWEAADVVYRDTRGDVVHRDAPGYGGRRYVNGSGRNDIVLAKVAADATALAFYAETAKDLTPSDDPNWMLLLIDADADSSTGWHGYDFIVNRKVVDAEWTEVERWSAEANDWRSARRIAYRAWCNRLELAIPLDVLGLKAGDLTVDFKWADNPANLSDPIALCVDGDTAPNRRFNYRFRKRK